MRKLVFLALVAMFVIAMGGSAFAATISVPADQPDLQSAIAAAAAGDTIDLAAGSFTTSGQVVIDKSLTITGAGVGATTIQPLTNTGTVGDARGWFLVQAGNTLTISALTLDGNDPAVKTHTAIRGVGNVVASDIRITNVKYQSYLGLGMQLYAAGNTITNCTFDDIERVGVWVGTAGATATITGCTFTGSGAGDYVQYGVEAGAGGDVTVSGCTFSNYLGVAVSDGSGSAAVLASTYFGAGTAIVVDGCTITNCSVGVNVGYDGSDTTDATVTDSTFTNVEWDIVSTATSVESTGNTFTDGFQGYGDVWGIPLGVEPSVIGAGGQSRWTYQDLSDAAPKYEGGYVAFDNTEFAGDYDNPHGGYDTATNKCKVCHAVHRAEGAYYLLRADSQDDACDYCHIGGSAHSSKVVYDLNSAGKSTTNGHTIGASTYIPDSSVAQWTEAVTLETVDADMNPLSEDIEVRAYDEQKNDMYRFARHHGHSSASGGARRNYIPIGPLALRCMSCHQVHNAEAQTWNSVAMANLGNAGQYTVADAGNNGVGTSSYKLLKQFPSGTYVGGLDSYGQVSIANISLVPETTLTAGVNFDAVRTMGADPTALNLVRDFNNDGDVLDSGETAAMNKPMWVAQNFNGEHDPAEYLAEEAIAASVNNAALSVWCADCHNLNIGGWEHLTNTELGFKAHTERTHPAPYTGAHSGPGQCYSCHRNDLPRINTGDSCSQCHYGTGNYKENRTAGAEFVASDFPHSGEDGDYKMLGSYSIVRTDLSVNTVIDDAVTVGPTNLDAVCIRCHGGIGTFH